MDRKSKFKCPSCGKFFGLEDAHSIQGDTIQTEDWLFKGIPITSTENYCKECADKIVGESK